MMGQLLRLSSRAAGTIQVALLSTLLIAFIGSGLGIVVSDAGLRAWMVAGIIILSAAALVIEYLLAHGAFDLVHFRHGWDWADQVSPFTITVRAVRAIKRQTQAQRPQQPARHIIRVAITRTAHPRRRAARGHRSHATAAASSGGDSGDGEPPRPRSPSNSSTPPLHHSLTHSLIFFGGA